MTEKINAFTFRVALNFVSSITGALEDAVYEKFECDRRYLGAILIKSGGIVSIIVTTNSLTEREAISQVKNTLAEIMFNMQIEELK